MGKKTTEIMIARERKSLLRETDEQVMIRKETHSTQLIFQMTEEGGLEQSMNQQKNN